MPNLPISGLTASASNAAATDVLPVVQTTGTGPVKMTVQQMAGGLLGSTTLSGATITADAPVLNMSQTWNASGVTFTGLKLNVTEMASASGSLLLDLGTGGGTYVSKFNVRASDGQVKLAGGAHIFQDSSINCGFYSASQTAGGAGNKAQALPIAAYYYFAYAGTTTRGGIFGRLSNGGSLELNSTGLISFTNSTDAASGDTILTRRGTANLRLGAADAAGSAISISSVASNQLTLASSHGLTSGAAVIITGTTAPSGTSLNTLYYARSISAAVIELYSTFDQATATSGTTGIVAVTTAGTSASIRLSTPFQRLSPQDFTGTDIPGQPLLINGSRGTGTGPGGSIIFQVAPAVTTGSVQNALATALTIDSTKNAYFTSRLGFSANNTARAYNDGMLFSSLNTENSILLNFNGVLVNYLSYFAFSSGDAAASADTILRRDDANKLALRNGANAQTFRVYNTFTSFGSGTEIWERGAIEWSSNVLRIATSAGANGGSNRQIEVQVGSARKWQFDTVGSLGLINVSTRESYQGWDAFCVRSDTYIGFASSTTVPLGQGDTNLTRVGVGILGVRGSDTTTGGALSLIEQTAPAAPAANGVYIYAVDNGSGKTQLMALFGSGVAQQIAIEP